MRRWRNCFSPAHTGSILPADAMCSPDYSPSFNLKAFSLTAVLPYCFFFAGESGE